MLNSEPLLHNNANEKTEHLHFTFLPAYATFLLSQYIHQFNEEQLKLSGEHKIPLMKFFEVLPKDELMAISTQGSTELLSYLSSNKIHEYINLSVQKWLQNQLPIINKNQICPEDITLVSLVRRKLFRTFLPFYTTDVHLIIDILNEVDRFTVEMDTVCFKTLIDIQQDLYKQAQALAHIGDWHWDLRAGKLTWSEELYKMYEIDPSEEVRSNIAEFNFPDDAQMINEQMQRSRETLSPHDFLYRIITKTGKHKVLHAKGRVIANANNEPSEIIGTLQDVTEQKVNEKELSEKTKFIQKIANIIPCVITVYNIDTGKYIFVNQAAHTLLGYNLNKVLNGDVNFFISAVHPEDRDYVLEKKREGIEKFNHLPGVNEPETINELRYRLKHANGSYRWVHTYETVFSRNTNHKVQEILNVSIDITDLISLSVKLEETNEFLKKSEERYHKIVAEVEDYAILSLTKDGIIENWNKGAEKIKGYKAQEIVGKHFSMFYTREDQKSNLPYTLIEHARHYGKAAQEGWRVRNDGTTFWGSIVITALHDDANNVIGFSKVTRDLTEKKIAEDKLRESARSIAKKNEDLININKELDSFTYMASHDLQEPLRKIRTFTDIILKKGNKDLTPELKDYFSRIINAATRMQKLIASLLTYSRTNKMEKEMVNLKTVMQDVEENLSEIVKESNAKIEFEQLPSLKAMPLQMEQLFTNLIENAIKYRKQDAAPVIKILCEEVDASSFPAHNDVETFYKISIHDNGIGFEQEYAEKVFVLFQRLHGQNAYSGTGIGLAICKKIIQNHNGFISAKSNPGEGSTFEIYLPKNEVEEEPIDLFF